MKILILQEIIPIYRKRLFDFFAFRYPEIQLTVASTSFISDISPSNNISYQQFISTKRGGLNFVKNDLRGEINKYDVVVILFDVRWISFMLLLFSKRSCRIFLWGHGYSNKSSNLLIRIRRFLASYADGIIFYDTTRRQIFSNSFELQRKSFTAPNTLVVTNHGYSKNSIRDVILFVGRINKNKKVHDLLKAFILISHQLPSNIKLVIVGEGECKDSLLEEAISSGLPNIQILGSIYDENTLKSLYDKALVSVIPGTVGLGIVTSFAYGVPIVYANERYHGPEIKYATSDNSYQFDGSINNLGNVLKNIISSEDLKQKSENAYVFYKKHLLPEIWADEFKKACLGEFR